MAPKKRSPGRTDSRGFRRQRRRTQRTPTNEAALSRNVASGPAAATSRPPSAGPAARAMLKPMLWRVTAPGRSSRGTSSGTIDCQAGPLRAAPSPRRKVKRSSSPGVVTPASVSTPSIAALASIQLCVNRRTRRRSITSARAPAGRESRNIGRLVTACTSATMVAEAARLVISHDAPTLWTQVPKLEATLAIQSARKTGWRSARQFMAIGYTGDVSPVRCLTYDGSMWPVFADPKTDFVFKRIFGTEPNKHLLVELLNALLELEGEQRIADLAYLGAEQRVPVAELKLSIVDVKCRDHAGREYVVEMQILNVEAFEKR